MTKNEFNQFDCLYSASTVVGDLLRWHDYNKADRLKLLKMQNTLKSMAFKAKEKGE